MNFEEAVEKIKKTCPVCGGTKCKSWDMCNDCAVHKLEAQERQRRTRRIKKWGI